MKNDVTSNDNSSIKMDESVVNAQLTASKAGVNFSGFTTMPLINVSGLASTQQVSNEVIVRTNDIVDIELSISNVQKIANTWYKNSTAELYNVLGQCYELFYVIETSPAKVRDKYKDEVKVAYDKLNGGQRANTMPNRIVSLVFNFADLDRRQRSRYSRVIKAAFDEANKATNADEFVNWLNGKGGIVATLEKCNTNSAISLSQSEINEQIRNLAPKATISVPNAGNKFVVLLASPVDDNTVEVLYQFDDESISNKLATKAYKDLVKQAKEAEKRKTASQIADAIAEQCTAKEEA